MSSNDLIDPNDPNDQDDSDSLKVRLKGNRPPKVKLTPPGKGKRFIRKTGAVIPKVPRPRKPPPLPEPEPEPTPPPPKPEKPPKLPYLRKIDRPMLLAAARKTLNLPPLPGSPDFSGSAIPSGPTSTVPVPGPQTNPHAATSIQLPNDAFGLMLFYNGMFIDRGFQLPVHLTAVCMALMDERIKKLLIILGPGSGKSLLLSVAFPAFSIGQDPSITVLGTSAGELLMQGFMSTVQEWIEFSPDWRVFFPNVRPDKARGWSSERGLFVTGHLQGDPDASYFVAGLTSKSITGKHGRVILGDDFHDKENSQTAEACLRVRELFYSQILGRADPKTGARFVFAGRRWHEEDIYGHLKQSGDWVVMELPVLRPGSTKLYWDVTIPKGLVCCFNEHLHKPKEPPCPPLSAPQTDPPPPAPGQQTQPPAPSEAPPPPSSTTSPT